MRMALKQKDIKKLRTDTKNSIKKAPSFDYK